MPVFTVQSGRDIFSIGDVIEAGFGTVRVTAKKKMKDYVVYSVEQVERKQLSPYPAPESGLFPFLRKLVSRLWSGM